MSAQPTTPPRPETPQNGAPRAPGTPFGQPLPSQPQGYLTVVINGTSRKIPYYAT